MPQHMSSRFVKNAGTLLSGSVIAQGIAFVAYLLLSRLYTSEDFGLYNVFYSYIEVLIILSTCKYEMAIVKASTDTDAYLLTRFTLRLNAVVSALLLVAAGLLTCLRVDAIPLPPLLLLLIPPMVFFCGTTRVYTFVFNRYRHFQQIAASEVVTSLSGVVAKILFGLLAAAGQLFHLIGLPVGTILGKVAGNVYYRIAGAKLLRSRPASSSNLLPLLKQHKAFPLYSMPRELVSSFSANLPFMWLSLHFDIALLGLFSLAVTFTMRPVNLLANVFEKVFYPTANQKIEQGQPIGSDIRKFLLTLAALVLPVLLVAFFFAEPLFTFLFGSKWVGTGFFVRCIIPWLALLLFTNSLAFIPNVFTTQRGDFVFQVVQLGLRIVALSVGILRADFRLAILLFCAVSTLVQLCQLLWYLSQVRRYDKQL
ncbi:MAG: oligosaccharide flippase family protein [Bacteroidales bacterium]|nr:oligosaccharide flippase family protein [Bacteroidales bacterium]